MVLTAEDAVAAAVAYVLSHQYVIKQEAETEEEPRRIFFLLDRYYWYECVLEKTQPTAGPMTFIASFIYFASSEEALRSRLKVRIRPWKVRHADKETDA